MQPARERMMPSRRCASTTHIRGKREGRGHTGESGFWKSEIFSWRRLDGNSENQIVGQIGSTSARFREGAFAAAPLGACGAVAARQLFPGSALEPHIFIYVRSGPVVNFMSPRAGHIFRKAIFKKPG